MDDLDLLNEIKAGEKNAFNKLVSLYENRLLNTCYRFLLNKKDAEDICQEVFIEIFQSIHSFRGESKLSTWIHRIAISKCLDELKKRKRKKRITSIGKLLHIDEFSNWIGGGKQADEAIQEIEQLKEITIALNTLPDNQRIAFTLSKIDGYSNAEIAEIMNTTTIAVESLIYRGKKTIGTKLMLLLSS
jgi:RNA polymerase sigma-70 factor, ECF subfamily